MTAVGLILAIEISGLAFALALARWLATRDAGGAELRRVGAGVGRAVEAFMARELRVVSIVGACLAAVVFGLHAALGTRGGPLAPLESAFWSALGVLIGAGTVSLVARLGARSALGATLRTLGAARHSTDRALGVAMRGGAVAGVLAESASVVSMALPYGLVFAMKGGLGATADDAAALAAAVVAALPSHALGVVAAALVLQRAGGAFQAASDVGAELGGERDLGLDHDDARNPAVIAGLVGNHVGRSATKAVDLMVSATVLNVTVAVTGVALYAAHHQAEPQVLGLVFLPLLVRAFGVIASAFGVMVVRTDETSGPSNALWRGQATTSVIVAGSIAGTVLWLAGDGGSAFLFWSGLLGLAAAALAAHAARYRVDRRFAPLRDLLDALRAGDVPGIAVGIASGLRAVPVPIAAMGAAMVGAWHLGAASALSGGPVVATLTALCAMLAAAPYMLAMDGFGAIADGARGVGALAPALSADVQRRAARLDDAGFQAAAVTGPYLIVIGGLSAAVATLAFPALGGGVGSAVNLAKPAVLWSGALGFAFVLAYAGSALVPAARGLRAVLLEIERQLRGFPRERGRPKLPSDFTPSYKPCIELSTSAALQRVALSPVAALSAPLVLGVAVAWLSRGHDPGLASEALSAFVAVAAVTAVAASLAADGARVTLSAARRHSRTGPGGGSFSAAIGAESAAAMVGTAAGPAATHWVRAAAVLCLTLAPFLAH